MRKYVHLYLVLQVSGTDPAGNDFRSPDSDFRNPLKLLDKLAHAHASGAVG